MKNGLLDLMNSADSVEKATTKKNSFVIGKTYIAQVIDVVAGKTKKNEDKAVFTITFESSENLPIIHLTMVEKNCRGWLIEKAFDAAGKQMSEQVKQSFQSADFPAIIDFLSVSFVEKNVRLKAQERDENGMVKFFLTSIVREVKDEDKE